MNAQSFASDIVATLVGFTGVALLWLVLLLAVLYFFIRVRGLQTLGSLRKRLAADLHDDIGANLSQLAILSEVLRHQLADSNPQIPQTLDSLARIARESVSALGDIVWTTNPEHDYLANLVGRMRRFASDLLPAAGIDFTFHAPNAAMVMSLEADLRREIFLIFKESLNNLVRHSGCTQAVIELWLEGQQFCLQIRDNGKGFDCAQQQEGNGLQSLRQRARRMGAQLDIVSRVPGTSITLGVRLPRTFWRSWLRQLQQQWRAKCAFVTSYLNRGVTAAALRSTIPSQPISVRATNTRAGH